MASLHLQNVPSHLYATLRARAERQGRSVEEEAVACLDTAVGLRPRSKDDAKRVLQELDRFRGSLSGIYITEEQLRQMKDEGRP
jgi:plasmid stability protein